MHGVGWRSLAYPPPPKSIWQILQRSPDIRATSALVIVASTGAHARYETAAMFRTARSTEGALHFQVMEDLTLLWIPVGLVFIVGAVVLMFVVTG